MRVKKENIKDEKLDFTTFFIFVSKQIQLNFKYIGASKTLPIFLFIFIMFPILGAIFFIPLRMIGPLVFDFSCFMPTAILYGSITYNLKNSTLNNNLLITKNSKLTFYISSLLTLIMMSFLIFLISLIIIQIFSLLNLLMIDWLGITESNKNYFNWANLDFLIISYVIILGTILTFSIMFCFQTLFKNKNSYYIFVFLLMILCIVFGGVLNDYFIETKNYGNRVFPIIGGSYLFPKNLFFPTLFFFPFFNIGEISSIVFKSITNFDKIDGNIIIGSFRNFNDVNFNSVLFLNGPISNWQWNIVTLMPYIHILIFVFLGKFFGLKKNLL